MRVVFHDGRYELQGIRLAHLRAALEKRRPFRASIPLAEERLKNLRELLNRVAAVVPEEPAVPRDAETRAGLRFRSAETARVRMRVLRGGRGLRRGAGSR